MAAESERKGNIQIIISDDEDEGQDLDTKVKEDKQYEFEGLDATIVIHFSKNILDTLVMQYHCLIDRKPSYGQPETLTIKQIGDKHTKDVTTCLEEIQRKKISVERRELRYTNDKREALTDFILNRDQDKGTVLYDDTGVSTAFVVGEDHIKVEETIHELKVHLGLLTPSYRSKRQLSVDVDEKADNLHSKHSRNPPSSPSMSNHVFTSSNKDENFFIEVKLTDNCTFKAYKASITKIKVDSIVNAANDNLMHGGGVARVISRAAGRELDMESHNYVARKGVLKVTENCLTTAGKLPYQKVIHAVGPQWHDYRDKVRCMDDVYDTVFKILLRCNREGYRSVGIPAISAGIYGVPKVLCADMYVKAAADFSQTNKQSRFPCEIHFIDVDMEILRLVKESAEKWKKNPKALDQRSTVPDFLESNPKHRSYSQYQDSWSKSSQGQGQSSRQNRTFKQISNDSPSDDNGTVKYSATVEQFGSEKFRWGGEATVFSVGTAVTVKIFKGDIDRVKNLDALVCGINSNLESMGFLAKALKTAGGNDYEQALKTLKSDSHNSGALNDVYRSRAGRLGVKQVLHLVNNQVTMASKQEVDNYKKGVYNVLDKAKQCNCRTLALPMIGTGKIQKDDFKLKKCGSALLQAICDFCTDENEPSVTEVHLINNSEQVCEALLTVFKQACESNTSGRNKGSSTGGPSGATSFPSSSRSDRGSDRPNSKRLPLDKRDVSPADRSGSFNDSSYNQGVWRQETSSLSTEPRTYTPAGRVDGKYGAVEEHENMEVEENDHDDENDKVVIKPEQPKAPRTGNLTIIEAD